ncbi:hypothetical protein ASPZODRAFT_126944 [Penicilliopsis zonata CBS 506.65]|uniref:Capsule polysaccharide biosynthesis protein n=1 Tax=Penicilliopsis zonata CBS 506.65 TaxID=1073090 RepID=A0A1L9SUR1_9EURO|nr:hypothetical protein ASPZODRAFT_126944 [Penicilliopsis zonata CBS 506.65]OJJ50965.1 hypothetical protein ASPZODRAFT_126944 [Penicilliopsis zonata CBS 506.65]
MKDSPSPKGLLAIPEAQLDHRSDAEIIAELKSDRPLSSAEKNVWAFWHSGFDNMVPWTQRNVIGWVRLLGPEWTVRVLDRVPDSPLNISRFVDASFFPDAFNKNIMSGPSVGPHMADLIRLPLLYLYGGVWMDVGSTLFRHLDDVCWDVISDPETPYEICGFNLEVRPGVTVMMNSFVASRRGNGFIKRWHEIYRALWAGGATQSDGFHKHPLVAHLPLLHPPVDKIKNPDREAAMGRVTDYIAQILCFERLRKLVDPSDGFNGPKYYQEKMYLFPALQEMYYFQKCTGWKGGEQFQLLSVKREDSDGSVPPLVRDEVYKRAEEIVNDMVANTSFMKLSHGPPGELEALADLWDDPKNSDKDNEPGTFAAYLRYASTHFRQTRQMVPLQLPLETDVLHVGLLEEAPSHEQR